MKQSGVPRVKWDRTCFAWKVPIPKYDSKGRRNGDTNRMFSVKKFMVNGRSEAEADAAALEAAKAFRAELVGKGILKEPKELHQRRPWSEVEQADQEVASADYFEAKQLTGTTEKD